MKRTNSFNVKIWGSRGSLPAPYVPGDLQKHILELFYDYFDWKVGRRGKANLKKFLDLQPIHRFGGYGGNTPCVEVYSKNQQLIIDGGSGLRPLGYEMMKGPCGTGRGEVHLLFTHFHWDHLIGLPFFTPFFIRGNKIHVYSVQSDLKEVFQTVFRKPFFPIQLEKLAASIEYHTLQPRQTVSFNDMQVTPYQLDHPDPCWGYRIECDGRVYAHCVDTECTRVSRAELGPDLPLYQGVDLMLFDAQYTLMETIEKVNWGHAAASLGLDIAMREGIKRVVFVHHDPASADEKIAAAENQALHYYENQLKRAREIEPYLHPVDWQFGYEGLTLRV